MVSICGIRLDQINPAGVGKLSHSLICDQRDGEALMVATATDSTAPASRTASRLS